MNAAFASRPASPSIYSALLVALIVLAFVMQAGFAAAVFGGAPSFAAGSTQEQGVHPIPCVPCEG